MACPSFFFCCSTERPEADNESVGAPSVTTKSEITAGSEGLWDASSRGDAHAVRSMIAAKADVNAPNPNATPSSVRGTAIIYAARAGHDDVVRELLEVNTLDVNATADNSEAKMRSGQTALHFAARHGHATVAQLLLGHPDMNVNLTTTLGYPAIHVAAQCDQVNVVTLLANDPRCDLNHVWSLPSGLSGNLLKVAIFDGRVEVVRAVLSCKRKDLLDLNMMLGMSHEVQNTCLIDATLQGQVQIVKMLLDAKADSEIESSKGLTALEAALNADHSELVMTLIGAGVSTKKCFSPFHEALILGDAPKAQSLFKADPSIAEKEQFPLLHQAVFNNSIDALRKEIARLNASNTPGSGVTDKSGLPAVHWAIELGHWPQVRELLESAHGMPKDFVNNLLTGKFGKVETSPASFPGERIFDVFQALLADDAHIATESKEKAKGAFALMKPFCASIAALRYFEKHNDKFLWLSNAADVQSSAIYKRIDAEAGMATLEQLSNIGQEIPTTEAGIRQDDEGMLPKMEYFRDEEKRTPIVGDKECYAARGIAMLALAMNAMFEEDMRKALQDLIASSACSIKNAPPKTYLRMYNKLMSKDDHGNPDIPKPRPMKNVDVLRLGVACDDPKDMQRVYEAVKANFRILRVKNTHDPHAKSMAYGAYRSILVNFAYDTGITLKELVGTGNFDTNTDAHKAFDETGQAWVDYCSQLQPSWDWSWALEGLWYASRHEPDRKVVMSGEVQIILSPYMRGRELSHLLYKIARCKTGASEMVRDFAGSFREETEELKAARAKVKSILEKARQSRRPS